MVRDKTSLISHKINLQKSRECIEVKDIVLNQYFMVFLFILDAVVNRRPFNPAQKSMRNMPISKFCNVGVKLRFHEYKNEERQRKNMRTMAGYCSNCNFLHKQPKHVSMKMKLRAYTLIHVDYRVIELVKLLIVLIVLHYMVHI